MERNKLRKIVNIAAIAAIYVVVSLVLNVVSFGPIQVRLAEVLIITAIISKDGIYGLTYGTLITNALGSALGFSPLGIVDVIGGTLLTLISAILAYYLRNYKLNKSQIPLLSLFMPVIINMLGLPLIFAYVIHQQFLLSIYLSEVALIFIGQFVSCVILGYLAYKHLANQLRYYLS